MPALELERMSISAEPEKSVSSLMAEVGLNPDTVEPAIVDRLEILEEETATVSDASQALQYAEHIFDRYEQLPTPFDYNEKQAVRIGTVLADIGKSGPSTASPEEQRLVAMIFGVENIGQPDAVSLQDFLKAHLGHYPTADLQQTLGRLDNRITGTMTMRQFYNLHAEWTWDILKETAAIPAEAVQAAARHHVLEGVNTHLVTADDPLNRVEKLVILLDKYDALRRRGRKTHTEAITLIRGTYLKRSEQYRDDTEFQSLLENLDEAVGHAPA